MKKTVKPEKNKRPTGRQLRAFTLDRMGWRRKTSAERAYAKKRRARRRMARKSRRANR